MASLPNKRFLCNYNARDFVAATNTIPNAEGAIFQQDLVLSTAPSAFTETYIELTYFGMGMTYNFGSGANNPFVRSGNDGLTIILKFKPLKGGGNSAKFIDVGREKHNASQYNINYSANYSGRTTGYPSAAYITNGSPYRAQISAFRYENGTTYAIDYKDETLITADTGSYTWNTADNSWVSILTGIWDSSYNTPKSEFYWLYVSPEALTDAEIQKVIAYNEGVGISVVPDEINFSKWGDEQEITVESETDWTATTTDSWITIIPTTGESGTTVITVSGGANRGDATRSASIGFIDADENTAEVTIMQPRIVNEVPINKLYKGTLKLN